MTDNAPEDLHRLFAEYFNAGDLNSLIELYEEDAAFATPANQIINGKAAISEALQGLLSLKGKMEMTTRYAIKVGDTALLSSEWHLRSGEQESEPVEMKGRTTEIARLQEDGRWLFVADHPTGAS